MKAKYLCLAIPVFLLMALAMSGTASADTEVNVNWNSANPDIDISLYQHNSGTVWASVLGLGNTATSSASGEIQLSSSPSVGWGDTTAWQTTSFEDVDYQSSVEAYGDEGDGFPPGSSQWWDTIQSFRADGATSGTVTQGASAIRNFRGVEGFQNYAATGADLVVAGGFVYQKDWKWRGSSEVSYTGNAEGDVSGSQASIAGYQCGEYHTGFGADISGTEGTTFFGFSTIAPNPAEATNPLNPESESLKTFHTAVFGSGFSVWGESHTWTEQVDPDDYPWDYNFNWIEPS